jgi:signal transduction histidine kinase
VTGELPPLPPPVRSEILLIVQEALANVRKHADATVVRVTVTSDGPTAVLTVADNGRGFATGEATGTGFGIRGMRERAALVGAELEIISRPRDGTRVVVRLPR